MRRLTLGYMMAFSLSFQFRDAFAKDTRESNIESIRIPHATLAHNKDNMKNICPPNVVARIQSLDLTQDDHESLQDLFIWIESESKSRECVATAISLVANKLTTKSDRQAIADFCILAATYVKHYSAKNMADIKSAYARFPYSSIDARNYFIGLEKTRIDIRERLKGRIGVNWSFPRLRQDDETWVYYRYLASVGEPGALEALAKKIASTTNGNDVSLFLVDLSDLQVTGVDGIIRNYEHDTRRADGPSGPGLMISEWVKLHSEARQSK